MLGFLVAYGGLVFLALLGAGALLGAAIWRALEVASQRARWRTRARGASVHTDPSGEPGLVELSGRLEARGAEVAVQTVAAGSTTLFDPLLHSRRAERLTLVTGAGEIELEGPVHVVAGPRAAKRRAAALVEHARATLSPEEAAHLDDLPLQVREVARAERVMVFGRLELVPDRGESYRASASRRVIRAGDDPDGILMASSRRRGAGWGAVLGATLVLAVIAAIADYDSYPRPSDASLIAPWTRPWALRTLRTQLASSIRWGTTREHVLVYLEHLAPPRGLERARALRAAGRPAAARREAVRDHDEPFVRADRLAEIELRTAAIEELRRVDSPEARAREVLTRSRRRYFVDAQRLSEALTETCGDDWTCAAHPRLLWWRAPGWRSDIDVLLDGRAEDFDPTMGAIMLRVAGDERVGNARVARCRIRWLMDLAANQMKRGAIDQSRETLSSARRSLDRWPRHTVDLARDVGHLESAAELLRALEMGPAPVTSALPLPHEDAECPLHPWLTLVRDPATADSSALSYSIRSALGTLRRGELPGAMLDESVMAIAWVAPLLEPSDRSALAESILLGQWQDAPMTPSYPTATVRRATRARALRRLGHPQVHLEAEIAAANRRLYGW